MKHIFIVVLMSLAFLLSACAGDAEDSSVVSFAARPTHKPKPTVTTPPPTTTPPTTTTPPPSGSLLNRTDLIYGSEIGAWDKAGGPAVQESTGVPQRVRDANVRVIRYAAFDCFANMTCGRDNHTGTILRSDFNTVVQGIKNENAVLWLKMVPIANDLIGTIHGEVFCPPWTGDASANLPMYKEIIRQVSVAGYTGPLIIESNNEMEYACWEYWKSQGASISGSGSVGVSKRIGEHYAQTMPALKTYAQSLGFSEVVVGGYIGTGGGTQWGQACTADSSQPFGYNCAYSTRWMSEFNTAVHDAYVAHGSDPNYIPDFEAIHSYNHSPDFSGTAGYEFPDGIVYSYYRNWLVKSRGVANSIWGTTIGNNIRFSISEWNAGSSNSSGTWSGWTTPGRPEAFFAGWYNMLRGNGVTTGAGTAYWNSNLFLIAGESDTGGNRYYNWIRRNGTVPSWYDTIKDYMTGVK